MRLFKFFFFSGLTLALVILLDRPTGSLPAMGPLFNPFGGFWANANSTEHTADETHLILPGLSEKVEVKIDSRAVPHIYASNMEDAVFAQGFITARDRLWQMEFQTHAAAGRLASLFGPDAEPGDGVILKLDRKQRRVGMGLAAERAIQAIENDAEINALVNAYSNGINAYISSLKKADYPIEYKLMGYEPETWSPLKTAYLLKYMGQMLTAREFDLEYSNLREKIGQRAFKKLYNNDGGNLAPVVPSGTAYDFEPVKVDSPTNETSTELGLLETEELDWALKAFNKVSANWDTESDNSENAKASKFSHLFSDEPEEGIGSNNWAVNGEKTASGNPILANDPHLRLNLPAIWYEVQLNAPGYNVYGASLPGAPGIVIGFNEHIAWGVTNAGRDVRDWYKIEFKDESKTEYHFDSGYLKTNIRVEKIEIKGYPTLYDTVHYTHHGPIVYDDSYGHAGLEGYALKWELHEPSLEMRTFFELNRGKTYADYKAALQYYQCPGQNFVFASTQGDIAITQQGRFAARWPEQGRFLMDGSKSINDWSAYIPSLQNATVLNPPQNYVSSANQFPADSTYPYYQLGNFAKYRCRRINNLLDEMQDIVPDDFRKMQTDNYHTMAADILPLMLELFPKAEATLGNWDYMTDPDSKQATRFQAWYDTFSKLIWDEIEGITVKVKVPHRYYTNLLMMDNPDSKWFDIIATPQRESINDLLSMAWDSSQVDLEWYRYKRSSAIHLVPTLEAFSEVPLECGGYTGVVNANSQRMGSSFRIVVELSKPPKAWTIYPGGQSGNPGSGHYIDYLAEWERGELLPVNFWLNKAQADENSAISIVLENK